MADRSKSLVEKIVTRMSENPGEHVLNVLKAGMATVPFAGGIASLMSDYIPSSRLNRLEKLTEQVAGDLTALQDCLSRAISVAITFDEWFALLCLCASGGGKAKPDFLALPVIPAVLAFDFSDSCTALKKQRFSNPPRVKDEGLWY
jgi:hypothetical protein